MTSGNRGDHGVELRDGTSGCFAAGRYSCIVPGTLLVEGKNTPLKILLKNLLNHIGEELPALSRGERFDSIKDLSLGNHRCKDARRFLRRQPTQDHLRRLRLQYFRHSIGV